MNNYASAVQQAGIGRTPQLCQDALIEMLEELFQGKKFMGQKGRKPLKIYAQDLPIPADDDDDVDTVQASAPYIIVGIDGGSIPDDNSTQLVEITLTICAYDDQRDREGFRDVVNIKEDIIQRICVAPYFGGCFTVLKPIAWALQQETTAPYYYGACTFTCTAPALTQDSVLADLV